ncbi:hypothetical protein MMC22_009273 [Lobaria immixta]|nr:hypothetical protein [Lobaria immixta]
MLGRLRMTIDEAIEAYQQLSPKIFKKRWCAQSKTSKYTGAELNDYWFEGKNLKDAVQNLLQDRKLDPDMKLLDSKSSRMSPSFVCAASAVSTQIELLRSYKSRRLGHRNYDCFMWEAVRAKSAAPLFFEPIALEASKATFVDGGIRANNPIDQLTSEARQLWLDRDIGCLVSLGTGVKVPQGFSSKKSRLHEVLQSLADIATDADHKARGFRDTQEGRELVRSKKYYRYAVTQGVGDVDPADFEKIHHMESMTLPYISDVDDSIENCARNLALASLGQ